MNFTDRQTNKQTNKHTDKQTYRQTNIQTNKQIDKQTYRQTNRHLALLRTRQVRKGQDRSGHDTGWVETAGQFEYRLAITGYFHLKKTQFSPAFDGQNQLIDPQCT